MKERENENLNNENEKEKEIEEREKKEEEECHRRRNICAHHMRTRKCSKRSTRVA